jgi:hypothetical protein
LFIVPWLAAGIRSGRTWAKAPSKVSTIRWLVSTFPPATGAGQAASTTDRSGVMTRIGRSAPALFGTPSANSSRNT